MTQSASGPPHGTLRTQRVRPFQHGKQLRCDLLHRVRVGDVQYARRLTHSRTVIVLSHAGEELAFIYSSVTKRILCFLPEGAPETEDWRRSQAGGC